ncbi:hypothetical protein PBCV1_a371R [Paramecium bursaria Chlorella virus 1]|uniref:Uncharacterized protein n=1 Tax=Paramecium bursaria Chlorella virus 1 TaxID=10506 RepID=Q98423_PBCV1|nr:hypothetical protein PBCV1_a371R [Paramecium bursaria Chlorella virus 1]AAC96739.2 hypothetical protein [Paramecium bursaria Chlorella virus 1]
MHHFSCFRLPIERASFHPIGINVFYKSIKNFVHEIRVHEIVIKLSTFGNRLIDKHSDIVQSL